MKGQSCGNTLSNCEGVMRSTNLLHKQGFLETLLLHTVSGAIYFLFFLWTGNLSQSMQLTSALHAKQVVQ